VYTFAIYAFDVHFNSLFVFYCILLGLSFYSLAFYFYSRIRSQVIVPGPSPVILKLTGYYLMLIATLFYILWLLDAVPPMLRNEIPESLVAVGLPTNPVHVIDLSIILPGMFLTGTMLIRQHALGWIMTPVILVFTVLMNLTIGGLMIVMRQYGLESNPVLMLVMFALAFVNVYLLIRFFRIRVHETTLTDV
jgi:hypothetical protein